MIVWNVRFFALAIALCLLFTGGHAIAQSSAPGPLKLTKIDFSGLELYNEDLALEASGLQAGQSVTAQDLDAASARLISSGLFIKAGYKYTYLRSQAQVTFEVTERKWNTPIVFDNFVWLSDAEMADAIVKRYPFFRGKAPDSGGVLDSIKAVLLQLLNAHGLPGQVEYISQVDMNGRNEVMIFSISSASLPVCEIRFPRSAGSLQSELSKSSAHFIGQQYSRSALDYFATSALRSLYGAHGYLKAGFNSAIANLSQAENCKGGVIVSLNVNEGFQYFWDGAIWAGNQALSEDVLNSLLSMKTGEVASTKKIDDGFKAIKDSYGRNGYLEELITPRPEFNEEQHRVTFRLSVREGPQYRMGKLIINGISEADGAKLRAKWKLNEGAVFDDVYPTDFVKKSVNARELGFAIKAPRLSMKYDTKRAIADVVLEIQRL
ncbi:MAG TPA: POTRA domain-containing protein [Blastocatellia bacterium]